MTNAMIRIFIKHAPHSRRIFEKSARRGELGGCRSGERGRLALGQRGEDGAKMADDFLTGRVARQEPGRIARKRATWPGALPNPPQHPRIPADLAPAWRGPRKDVHNNR